VHKNHFKLKGFKFEIKMSKLYLLLFIMILFVMESADGHDNAYHNRHTYSDEKNVDNLTHKYNVNQCYSKTDPCVFDSHVKAEDITFDNESNILNMYDNVKSSLLSMVSATDVIVLTTFFVCFSMISTLIIDIIFNKLGTK